MPNRSAPLQAPDPKLDGKLDDAFGPINPPVPAGAAPGYAPGGPILGSRPHILSGAITSDPIQLSPEAVALLTGQPAPPVRNVDTQLAAFQAELPKIEASERAQVKPKDGSAGFSYAYAGLDIVSPVVLRALGKLGLAWVTRPTMTEKGFALLYELKHGESGTSIEGVWPLAADTRNPQAAGSAITYARRYALMAVTGVFPGGEDDDGAAAKAADARRQTSGRQVEAEMPGLRDSVARAQRKAEEKKADPAAAPAQPPVSLAQMRVEVSGAIAATDFPTGDWLRATAGHLRALTPADFDLPIGLAAPGKTLREAWANLLKECAGAAETTEMVSTVAKAANHTGVFDAEAKAVCANRRDYLASGGPAGLPTPEPGGFEQVVAEFDAATDADGFDPDRHGAESYDGEPPY